ncbi:MAG: TatD family deoxyribonuclease [Asgard group archaeon]|nr:TatD family deoxyribonuclease [Asgard group archaeon]
MYFLDCHCHLADNFFYRKIDDMISEWKKYGLVKIGTMSTNIKSIHRNIKLSLKYPDFIICGIGRHPWGAHKISEEELSQIEKLLIENKKAIIGEVGLDYYFIKEKEKQEKQKPLFIAFLKMAQKHKRPLMLHTTGAEKDIFQLLSTFQLKVNICCHWYSGHEKILRKLNDMGCFFSINPAFVRSKNHRKILEIVSLERLITESDGPIKSIGITNTPKLMPELISKIAKELKIKNNELAMIILENFSNYLKS